MQQKKSITEKYPQMPEIVERLRSLLRRGNHTQKTFCDRVGIQRSHLASVLTCRNIISGRMVMRLADAGYDLTWILTGKYSAGESTDTVRNEYLTQRVADLEGTVAQQKQMIDLCQTAIKKLS